MRTALAIALLLLYACSEPGGSEPLGLHQLRGQWVVINYWAEWCKPCIKEIPELNALDAKYPQVAVVGVNFDGETGDVLRQQIDRLGIAFPVLGEEPSAALGVPLPSVLPATFIFDPDGKLAHSLVGPQTLESLAAATGQVGMPTEAESQNELQPN